MSAMSQVHKVRKWHVYPHTCWAAETPVGVVACTCLYTCTVLPLPLGGLGMPVHTSAVSQCQNWWHGHTFLFTCHVLVLKPGGVVICHPTAGPGRLFPFVLMDHQPTVCPTSLVTEDQSQQPQVRATPVHVSAMFRCCHLAISACVCKHDCQVPVLPPGNPGRFVCMHVCHVPMPRLGEAHLFAYILCPNAFTCWPGYIF